jgi:hypothetical protein
MAPLLEQCSLEEDEGLQEKWAALLAHTVSEGSELNSTLYSHILGQMTKSDADSREDDQKSLKKLAVQLTANFLSKGEAETAAQELIDPCNVLIPMTDDGKFGFGHLRFQEHLAAKEIYFNRSIEILPLLKDPWWHSTFIFFGQMNSELYWLIMDLGEKKYIHAVKNILLEMIETRPKAEQQSIRIMIDSFLSRDPTDRLVREEK